jgi:hypothetical protein
MASGARLLGALLPLLAALLAARHGGPGSPLHAQLAAWPAGQAALEQAHGASLRLGAAAAGAAQHAQRRLGALLPGGGGAGGAADGGKQPLNDVGMGGLRRAAGRATTAVGAGRSRGL